MMLSKKTGLWRTALALVMLFSLGFSTFGMQGSTLTGYAQPPDGVKVHAPVRPLLSRSIRDMPVARRWQPGDPQRVYPEGAAEIFLPGVPPPPSGIQDPVWQSGFDATDAHAQLSGPLQTFNGMATGSQPMDPVGDVGPNHYVQMVNSSFQIFDKQGNPPAGGGGGPFAINQIWVNAGDTGQCATTNDGDPIVLYDHLANRWLLSQFDATGPSFGMCIAISQTPDPTGNYFVYDFRIPAGQGTYPDYPKLGVWPDGYYMSSYEGANLGMYVFERSMMISGNPARTVEYGKISSLSSPAGFRNARILPSELDGPLPPAGSPNYFVRTVEAVQDPGNPVDRLEIFEASVNWGDPLTSSFSLAQTINTAAFAFYACANDANGNPRLCIPQPNTATMLDALMGRPMWRLQYRNFGAHETLVFNQSVDANGASGTGIRWYEVRRTPPGAGAWGINQQGTYAPQAGGVNATTWIHRWMGSMAMDKAGNIALAYNVSNDDDANPVFAGIRYTGRLAGDPGGILPQGEETLMNGGNFSNATRWGDYTSLNVDPVDDCTFWYTAEYIDGGNVRRTRIGSFVFPLCSQADLQITKTDSPDPATAGGQLFYDISVTNNGPDTATNVTVVDTLPAGVDYVTDTDSCVEAPAGTLTCSLGTILAGSSSSFTIKVAVPDDFIAGTGPVSITNQAVVSGDQFDPNLSNNTATASTIVEDSADLEVTKLCKPDDSVPTGQDFTCTIFVENLGPSSARSVSLRDEIVSSGDFTISSLTNDPNRLDSCTPAVPFGPAQDATVECQLQEALEPKSLSGGGSWEIKMVIHADEAQDINNCAQVFTPPGGTPDPDPSNNQSCDGVGFSSVADLALTKSDTPDPVNAGTTLTYNLGVTNNGPSTAVNVVVKDFLPAGVSIVSVSGTGGASCVFGVPGDPTQPTTCQFDSILSGASESMTIVVSLNIPGVLNVAHNDASVSSDTFDPNNADNVASQDTTIQVADLRIVKTSDADVYKPSSTVMYTVKVFNDGPADAANVQVTDLLPDFKQAVYQFADPNICVKVNATLTCTLGSIPAGGSFSFNIYMTIKGKQGEVSNTAYISNSSVFDPNGANNSSTLVVLVKGGVVK